MLKGLRLKILRIDELRIGRAGTKAIEAISVNSYPDKWYMRTLRNNLYSLWVPTRRMRIFSNRYSHRFGGHCKSLLRLNIRNGMIWSRYEHKNE